ncbi:MAG: ABC transporter permease [Bacteroidia bacterium]|nr:ABC transporter permease [Bacteroidia bacterium]
MTMKFALLSENFRIALRSISANLLRTILTVLIIGIGITALVGILTAIDALKASIGSEFSRMGANTFTIQNRGMHIHMGDNHNRIDYRYISFREAQRFKKEFNFPAVVSVSVSGTWTATLKYKSNKTNPNIPVIGIDELYITTSGYNIAQGRNFTEQEIQLNRNVAIIGSELKKNLFNNNENPLDKVVNIGNGKYRVIGVLEEKGTSMGGRGDKLCFLPLTNLRQNFSRPDMSYRISVMLTDSKFFDFAIGEAEGLFRIIRKLRKSDENNFEIIKSDSLVSMMMDNIKYVTGAAIIIGLITLIGAAIGLMNIMLVSVSERTREIGTRKAMGANSKVILWQFLFESIIIGQFGGILGIVLGIMAGNVVSSFTEGPFVVPWLWIVSGILLCIAVGLASGIIPAVRASKLDPIDALRYE